MFCKYPPNNSLLKKNVNDNLKNITICMPFMIITTLNVAVNVFKRNL